MSRYEVVPASHWRHEPSGRTASIYGACPWVGARPPGWEVVTCGWTVRNPFTGEVGTGRPAFQTEAEAVAYADKFRPSRICIGD